MPDGGDEAHKFCRRVRPRLLGVLGFLCGDRDVAEDLAQETMARVWVSWAKVGDLSEHAATAWTYRVAVNLAKSWLRRRAAERRAVARLATNTSEARTVQDAADAIAVRTAVASLSPRQRTALVLRYYADMPVTDVARLMGCAPGTVKALTSQAVSALRQLVPDNQGGVS